MQLSIGDRALEFSLVPLRFEDALVSNIFARKNNKTLAETLIHKKYSQLSADVLERYRAFLQRDLGDFLLQLKLAGDQFYRQFLNRYGDETYCEFSLDNDRVSRLTGLYCFVVEERIKYIGKSTDSFKMRTNQGYGHIHPKNCYRDGQATNCHLNALITPNLGKVLFFACPLREAAEIERLEKALIERERPEWNIQLKRAQRGVAADGTKTSPRQAPQ